MASNEETLLVIPARGGSKGIPGKNIRPLAGIPLIEHSIRAARAAKSVTRVVVSTDDAAIASVARKAGAEVVDRPPDISGDKASSESALVHVLQHLERTEQYRPARVVFVQCTSPLTTPADIDGIVATLIGQGADSAFSASRFYHFAWKHGPDGGAQGINHDQRVRPMRQDREPQFLENGALYAFKTAGFLERGFRFFGKTVIHEMPVERSLEIDELHDFQLAEWALAQQKH